MWSKNWSGPLPRARTSLQAQVHDKSGSVDPLLGSDCTRPYIYVRLPHMTRCPYTYAISRSQYFSRPPSRSRHRTAPFFLPSRLRLVRKQDQILFTLVVALLAAQVDNATPIVSKFLELGSISSDLVMVPGTRSAISCVHPARRDLLETPFLRNDLPNSDQPGLRRCLCLR